MSKIRSESELCQTDYKKEKKRNVHKQKQSFIDGYYYFYYWQMTAVPSVSSKREESDDSLRLSPDLTHPIFQTIIR
jgi:hypothetical protein